MELNMHDDTRQSVEPPMRGKSLLEANKQQLRQIVNIDERFLHSHWESQRVLVSFIPPEARTILDIGCGPTGDLLLLVPDMIYVGLDFVHDYLAALRVRRQDQRLFDYATRDWVASPMETLPFRDETFDVVYSRHSLEHSPNLDLSIKEIRRVLRPGGLFLFCVPSRVDDVEPTHLTRWSGRQWASALSQVGRIRFHAHHDYFIDEYYGCIQKSGGPQRSLLARIRRKSSFWHGQGVLPMWMARFLVKTYAKARALRLVK